MAALNFFGALWQLGGNAWVVYPQQNNYNKHQHKQPMHHHPTALTKRAAPTLSVHGPASMSSPMQNLASQTA